MNNCSERLYNGIVKRNPTFVLMLGICPTLTVTISAIDGLGMELSTAVVLLFSNMIIAALHEIIPDCVRIPTYIMIVASLVTIVQLLLQTYVPSLYSALGIYIPLIVVDCIILDRAEFYVSKNGPLVSTLDSIGMGLDFTIVLTHIGIVHEILGSGAIFGNVVIPEDYRIAIFIPAPSAFFVLAILTALQNRFKAPSATNGSVPKSRLVCSGNCMECSGSSCMSNHEVLETRKYQAEEKALAAKKEALAKKEAELKTATSKKENQEGGQTKELLLIAIGSALVNNVTLSQFLGLYPFLGVSKKVETSVGMGAAVTFVITIASAATSLVYTGILVSLHLEHLQTTVFILIIAALVQFMEMFLEKSILSLYEALGVYLLLITTNCAVLGVALTNVQESYNFVQSVVNGVGASAGFTIAIVMLTGVREKVEHNDVSYSFQGSPVVLIISGLMAIAFFGFSGLV